MNMLILLILTTKIYYESEEYYQQNIEITIKRLRGTRICMYFARIVNVFVFVAKCTQDQCFTSETTLYWIVLIDCAITALVIFVTFTSWHFKESVNETVTNTIIEQVTTLNRYPKYGMIKEQTQCSICLNNYEPMSSVRSLECGHIYHSGCINKALENNNRCPTCKIKLLQVIVQNVDDPQINPSVEQEERIAKDNDSQV